MSVRLRFLCPTCNAVMDAPLAQAGHKINCLKCGQRLQIPPPERAKTVLARGLGVHGDGTAPPSPAAAATGITSAPVPPPLPPDLDPADPVASKAADTPVALAGDGPPGTALPGTVMTAAALLLAYGGLILFCGCSTLAITATSANRQKADLFGPPVPNQTRGEFVLNVVSGTAQFLAGAIMIASGLAAFGRYPVGRWGGMAALLAQLLIMAAATVLAFLIINLQQTQPLFPGEGVMALVLIGQFFPYLLWLAFAVPTGVLLNAPSARRAFADRPFFGFRLGERRLGGEGATARPPA